MHGVSVEDCTIRKFPIRKAPVKMKSADPGPVRVAKRPAEDST